MNFFGILFNEIFPAGFFVSFFLTCITRFNRAIALEVMTDRDCQSIRCIIIFWLFMRIITVTTTLVIMNNTRKKKDKHNNAKKDPVKTKDLKAVFLKIIYEKANGKQGDNKSDHCTNA